MPIDRSERNRAICRDYSQGFEIDSLSIKYGVAISVVKKILSKQGMVKAFPVRSVAERLVKCIIDIVNGMDDSVAFKKNGCVALEARQFSRVFHETGIIDAIRSNLEDDVQARRFEEWNIAFKILSGTENKEFKGRRDIENIRDMLYASGIAGLYSIERGKSLSIASATSFSILGDILDGMSDKEIAEERELTEKAVARLRAKAMSVEKIRKFYCERNSQNDVTNADHD